MSRLMRLTLVTALGLTLFCALLAAPAGAQVSYLTSFGSAGTTPANPYPLYFPTGIAVNNATGDLYVADSFNNRVEQFDEDGNFIRMWGKKVNISTGGDICPETPGDVCEASPPFGSNTGDAAGWFSMPGGIAVDNSNGPAAGSVYVIDSGNNRVQRFTADGHFVLTWGKAVDKQSTGNVCTAASGHTCQAGLAVEFPSPTEDAVFSGWRYQALREGLLVATDNQGYVYVVDSRISDHYSHDRIQKFDSNGTFVGKVFTEANGLKVLSGQTASSPTVGPNGDVYVGNQTNSPTCDACSAFIVRFDAGDFALGGSGVEYNRSYGATRDVARVVADPTNGYLIALGRDCATTPSIPGTHVIEYQPDTSQEVDCTIPTSPTVDLGAGMAVSSGASHRLYMTNRETGVVQVFQPPSPQLPVVTAETATEITASGARINTQITGNLDETTFHVEYGTAGPCSSNPCTSAPEAGSIGSALTPRPGTDQINGLKPGTTYYYRIVATNDVGTDGGPDRTFTTFALPVFNPSCSNNLARQQSGAEFLFDCRSYELVSAEDQGGYDVESDLVPGQQPYGGYPQAKDKALYAIHNGGVPGIGKPTNRGPDPYVAVRDAAHGRWTTSYVGIPADIGSATPFSSTVAGADSSLSSFAFAGPEICDPCFANGDSGIPLRTSDGSLVQGMKGPVPVADPTSAGGVAKPLSANGTHLVFASKQAFVSGANENGVDVTIYNRDLKSGITRIASKLPDTLTIQAGEDVAELDVSQDGTRTLIGTLVSTDASGNRYYHLYMHVGSAINTIDLTPGTTSGVLFAGMNSAGTRVYFTTPDPLLGDGDTSADLYLANVGPASAALSRVSSGAGAGNTDSCDPTGNSFDPQNWNVPPGGPTDCSVVAIGGGGGVSSGNGTVYFFSPEVLDTAGPRQPVQNAPNLYRAQAGQPPKFVATLESSDNEPLKPKAHLLKHTSGPFSYPEGVAIDRNTGSYYVLDTLATSGSDVDGDKEPDFLPGAFVQKYEASGQKDLTFGVNSKLDGANSIKGPFLQSGVGFGASPVGLASQIAVDNSGGPSDGSLYVPDLINGVVDKFGPSGNFVLQVNIIQTLGNLPSAVAVNQANGRLFVAGAFASNVYTFNANGNPVAPNSFNVAGPAIGIGVDAAGNSYVANGTDTRMYSSTGAFVKVFDSKPSFGVSVDPGANRASAADDHIYIDHGDEVVEYDVSGNVVEKIQLGLNTKSVGLAADSGRVAISNPARGTVLSYSDPQVPPDSRYDSPLVIDSVRDSEIRHTAQFQATPDGSVAAFTSAIPATGFDNAGNYEVFRHEAATDGLACISCNPTEAAPSTDSGLATNGLSVTDDGRVFFNSGEPLVLRDSNARKDVYEWSHGGLELISTGLGQFDSSLLSVTADGTDAFFFTHDTLAKNDQNGTLVKLYTAREDGGFFVIPPVPQCKASDECHGPGSEIPAPAVIGTRPGGNGNVTAAKKCKRGFVRRGGRCVKRHRGHGRAKRVHGSGKNAHRDGAER